MQVAIHQPNFLPWQGYFHKMIRADAFVYLDDVQFSKNSFQNRSKIKTANGAAWLTVPILVKGQFGIITKNVAINNNIAWQKKHCHMIESAYRKSKYYYEVMDLFGPIYNQSWDYLMPLCLAFFQAIRSYLAIETPVYFSSDLSLSDSGTERLISICKKLDADTYISGSGGKNYQEEFSFKNQNIMLSYSNFQQKTHDQLYGEFIPGLSILDGLFNLGKNVICYIK